jgi:hypothetical protein
MPHELICTDCGRSFTARRSTRRTCSDACRQRRYRNRRKPRVTATVELKACTVEPIGPREATDLIMRFEPLRSMGRCSVFFGLRAPDGRLLGAVGFSNQGPHAATRADGTVNLGRGFCLPEAGANAGSFLIGRAIRWGRRWLGWRRVIAFSDPRFGERGGVYRGAGFVPSAPSKHGKAFRYGLIENGRVLSDRAIQRKFGSHKAAREADAIIVTIPARVRWEREI